MRSRKALPVDIVLDRGSGTGLRDQIVAEFARTIDTLALPAGTPMPSTRTLAEALGVSRSVAVAGYELLLARGYLEIRPGSGTYVARPAAVPARPPVPPAAPPPVDLRSGRLPVAGFPVAAWRSAWRHAAHRPPVGWVPDLGLPGLRRELRRHLETSRWQPLAGYEVVVTADLSHALRVLLAAFAPAGRVGIADLAPVALNRAGSAGGRPVVTVPVDDEGPVPAGIPHDVGALVVPAGAYRAGSGPRSRALAAWTAQTGGYVIEANLHTGTPTASPTRAGVVGSFTALFGLDLSVAYAVVPSGSADRVGRLLADQHARPPAVAQEALRHLLANRVVDRWAAALYRQRQAACATVTHVFAAVPGAVVTGPTLDGAAAVWLPPGCDAAEVVAAARSRGVLVSMVGGNGILVDIGAVDEVTARRALRILPAVVDSVGTRRSGEQLSGTG